jgi:hypothetical protein
LSHSISEDEAEAGEEAERLFREYCDRSGITYLFIEQSSYSRSSKLAGEQARRPDFLVIEPYKMPLFVDVKARRFQTPQGEPTFFLGDRRYMATFLSAGREYSPLRQFQNFVGIPVWVAWFERMGRKVKPNQMWLAPINALSGFHKYASSEGWMIIPVDCCASIDLKASQSLSYDVKEETVEKFVDMLKQHRDLKNPK